MSNTYQPILLNKITNDVVIEILNAVIPVFKELEIEYFVVGAFARDDELLVKGRRKSYRVPGYLTANLKDIKSSPRNNSHYV